MASSATPRRCHGFFLRETYRKHTENPNVSSIENGWKWMFKWLVLVNVPWCSMMFHDVPCFTVHSGKKGLQQNIRHSAQWQPRMYPTYPTRHHLNWWLWVPSAVIVGLKKQAVTGSLGAPGSPGQGWCDPSHPRWSSLWPAKTWNMDEQWWTWPQEVCRLLQKYRA